MKKGLSEIVTTVLIVLLALAAVAIVWVFIQPLFNRGGIEAQDQSKCFAVGVEPKRCSIDGGGKIIVVAGVTNGPVEGFMTNIEYTDGTIVPNKTVSRLESLSTLLLNFTPPTGLVASKVRTAAILKSDSGEEIICAESSPMICQSSVSSGATCTDADSDTYYAEGGACGTADCNDGNSAIHPGATETCNGIDDDCNGAVDDFCSYPSLLFVPPTPEGTVSGNSIFVNISSRYLGPKDQYVFLDVDNYNGWLLWLPMENIDGNGVPTDQSPRGQSLVKAGDAHQGSVGRFGNGFIFDASGDEVNVTTGNFNFPGQYSTFSLSFWFKNNAGGGTGGQLLSYGNTLSGQGWDLSYQGAGGALQFNAYRPGGYNYTRASGSYIDNNWHHLVFTKDYPSYGKFYIDGVDVTAPDSYPYHGWIYIQTITSPLVLGKGFNGELDDVMIWNKVLTLSEIRSLYNATAYPYARNITGQTHASHTLHAYAISGAGKRNETVRTVTLTA